MQSGLICRTRPRIYLDPKFVHRMKPTRTSWAKLKSMGMCLLHSAELLGDLIKTDGFSREAQPTHNTGKSVS